MSCFVMCTGKVKWILCVLGQNSLELLKELISSQFTQARPHFHYEYVNIIAGRARAIGSVVWLV